MPRKRNEGPDPMAHLHIEIEKDILSEVKRLNPGYGGVSHLIRKLLMSYLRVRKH